MLFEGILAGPFISDRISDSSNSNWTTHHKDIDLFEKGFQLKCSLLVETFQKFDNFFIDSPGKLVNIASKRDYI